MKLVILLFALFVTGVRAAEPKVILYLLDHTRKEETEKKFWIDWSNAWVGIIKTKEIEGEEAELIVKQLRRSLKNTECTNFCGHDPIYGIIAKNKEGRTVKTSLCFKCGTWVKAGPGKGLRLDIKGEFGIDNPLCLILREHLELPEALLKKKSEQSVPPKSDRAGG